MIDKFLPRIACIFSFGLLLTGCGSDPVSNPAIGVGAAQPSNIAADRLVGKWGLAAYHRDSDRGRTEKEARGQCGNPYVIVKGPGGGVMMHLADEKQSTEMVLKESATGKIYIGPNGAITEATDREITVFEPNLFITRWLSPEIDGRYGDSIYVRCGAK